MRVEIFALCDAATADIAGKLNLLGTFDSLFAPSVPFVHPSCALAVRVRFELSDEGTHSLEIRLADSDGKAILPAMRSVIQVKATNDLKTIARNLVLNIQQLKLERFGEYTLDMFCDGKLVASSPLYTVEKK